MYEMPFPRVLRLESDSPRGSRDMSSGVSGLRGPWWTGGRGSLCNLFRSQLRFSTRTVWECGFGQWANGALAFFHRSRFESRTVQSGKMEGACCPALSRTNSGFDQK
jgi:hypothetical protein